MTELKIGLLASLSGRKEKIGRGMLHSLEFISNVYSAQRPGFPSVKLVVEDDHGNPSGAVKAMEACHKAGCAVVFGPADSDSMFELLQKEEFNQIPIFSALATATNLALLGNANFFRCTAPDIDRADLLIRTMQRLYKGLRSLNIYAASGSPESYSQALKNDILKLAEKNSLDYSVHDYSIGFGEIKRPSGREPILICAQSADGVGLLKLFRKKGKRNQAFSFGSNTNWLHNAAVGTIVVCDLDRDHTDTRIREALDSFFGQYQEIKDPSISTMNGAFLLYDAIAQVYERTLPHSVQELRKRLIDFLHRNTMVGLFGPVSFTNNGEMVGFEPISLLKISKSRGQLGFTSLDRNERALLHDNKWWVRILIQTLGLVGAVASIVGLVLYFR